MRHRQYFTVLAGLLSLRAAVERVRCWNDINTAVRARARSGRVRAAELAEQLAAGCRLSGLAARQLDFLLEHLFGAPCVAPCAREAVEPSASKHVRKAARGPSGRAPQRGQGERALPATTGRRPCTASSTRRISAFPAPQDEPRRGPALSKVANGCHRAVPPRVGAAGPAQRQGAENATDERQAGHCPTTTGPVLELRRVLKG